MHDKHAQKNPTEYKQNFMLHRPGHSKETYQPFITSAYTEAVHHQELLSGTSILVCDH